MMFSNIDRDDPETIKAIGEFLEKTFPGFMPILILCEMGTSDKGTMTLNPFTITALDPEDLQRFFAFMARDKGIEHKTTIQ